MLISHLYLVKCLFRFLVQFFFSLIPLKLFLLRSTNDLKTEFIRLFSVFVLLGDSTVSDTLLLLLNSLIPPLNLLHYPLLDFVLFFWWFFLWLFFFHSSILETWSSSILKDLFLFVLLVFKPITLLPPHHPKWSHLEAYSSYPYNADPKPFSLAHILYLHFTLLVF